VLPEGVTSRDVYRGIIPFVVLQVIGLTLVVAFPWMATWLPTVLK
jgi:TRAP-type mannitol/chloroaromatic compound transport system permease large subunit